MCWLYIRGKGPRISADIRGICPGYNSHGYLPISRAYATDICRDPGHMPRISVGVQVKTLLVYHRKDKEGVEKAAEILARYQKPKELEVPKVEICKEPKAEPCVVHASPLKAVKAETVVVLGSPIKAEPCANNPIVHTPSPKHEVNDLTAEEDYATFPLTQLSEKENMVYEREMYRSRAWAAPATPAKAPTSQDLTSIPSPFDSARFDGPPTKVRKVQVKEEKQQCYRCDYPIKKNAASAGQRPVTCDVCHAIYHLSCANLRFPPKHGSWACETCMTEMIGSQ